MNSKTLVVPLCSSSSASEQLVDQFVADRIAFGGAIEGQQGNSILFGEGKCPVVHFVPRSNRCVRVQLTPPGASAGELLCIVTD